MYVIKKDGLYLMNYMYNGIREIVNGEELMDVPTAIYSDNIRDAQLVEHAEIAKIVGGVAIKVKGFK